MYPDFLYAIYFFILCGFCIFNFRITVVNGEYPFCGDLRGILWVGELTPNGFSGCSAPAMQS